MMGALLRDRAEQESQEATPAARSQHEQLGVPSRCDQSLGRRSDEGRHLDLGLIRRLADSTLQRAFDDPSRLLLSV
jgi:hypothetical protein